jgi:hypothetical protein
MTVVSIVIATKVVLEPNGQSSYGQC